MEFDLALDIWGDSNYIAKLQISTRPPSPTFRLYLGYMQNYIQTCFQHSIEQNILRPVPKSPQQVPLPTQSGGESPPIILTVTVCPYSKYMRPNCDIESIFRRPYLVQEFVPKVYITLCVTGAVTVLGPLSTLQISHWGWVGTQTSLKSFTVNGSKWRQMNINSGGELLYDNEKWVFGKRVDFSKYYAMGWSKHWGSYPVYFLPTIN